MIEAAAHEPEDTIALTDTRGKPRYDRRLADKVLAAFNHAYAVGAHDVARSLRDVLAVVEAQDPFTVQRRHGHQATAQADHWIAFVEARNDYRRAAQDLDADAGAVERALVAMKDAYRRWSAS
jgi:hypothetical protein